MRAVVHDRYGPPDVLRIAEVERPRARPDELLVRVRATTVNRTDCHRRAASPFLWRLFAGVLRPRRRILGSEFAGEVVEVGPDVSEFEVGDQVFGLSPLVLGAHAEYLCIPEGMLIAHMPAGTGFEQAAAVCDGALNALTCLRRAELRGGQKILIYGASGSIGTAAVQLAAYLGADVTAVCGTRNLELVRSLGARHVVDYTAEDVTRNGQAYDVIYDAVGKHSFARCKGSLKAGGTYMAADGWVNLALAVRPVRPGGKKVLPAIPSGYAKRDVLLIRQLIENGKYRAVIDRRYPLEQIADAARYVETGQKTGNVVITIDDSHDRIH